MHVNSAFWLSQSKLDKDIMKDEMLFRSILQHIHMFAVLFACEHILYKYNTHL